MEHWNYERYAPFGNISNRPYIERVVPKKDLVEVDANFSQSASFFYREKDGTWFSQKAEKHNKFNAVCGKDYEFYIKDIFGASDIRLARAGEFLGNVVDYLHPDDKTYGFSGQYLASPCIIKVKNKLLCSYDVFGSGGGQNLTRIFESTDNGETWNFLTELFPSFWTSLFYLNNVVYALSISCEYGDILIGSSTDEGKTWSAPKVIARGSCSNKTSGFHKAPVPTLIENNRLWIAVEWGCWAENRFDNLTLSIDIRDDIMNENNWTLSLPLKHDKTWLNALDIVGGIEGNMVADKDGKVLNILRYAPNLALVLEADVVQPEKPLKFLEIRKMPTAHTKFHIINYKNNYYMLGNTFPGRNKLCLFKSFDLKEWVKVEDIINKENLSIDDVGFQYPSFIIENDTLYALVRMADNGAKNFHDTNCITFHKLQLKETL